MPFKTMGDNPIQKKQENDNEEIKKSGKSTTPEKTKIEIEEINKKVDNLIDDINAFTSREAMDDLKEAIDDVSSTQEVGKIFKQAREEISYFLKDIKVFSAYEEVSEKTKEAMEKVSDHIKKLDDMEAEEIRSRE